MTKLDSTSSIAPNALTPKRDGRIWFAIGTMALLLVALMIFRLCIGRGMSMPHIAWPGGNLFVSLGQIITEKWEGTTEQHITNLRVMRVIGCCLVGAALAVSGVSLQSLLRNPLAEPFILGLSTGAAVGVMAQDLIAYALHHSFGPNHVGAILGAAVSMAIVFLASRRHGILDPLGLLLVGVVLGTINGAIILTINYIVGPGGLKENLSRWMMGYLNENLSSTTLLIIAGVMLASLILLLCMARAMDVASFSDDQAHSMGVNVQRLRVILFIVATTLAAGAVVLAGPVAFVGLISPHIARLLVGPSHRVLLIASALCGAILVVTADVSAALLDFGQGLLPIGIFTAFLGGPIFLWMLRPQLGRGSGE